jgi:hypothetical protein
MRLLAGAHALEPVGHMSEGQVVYAHRRKLGFAWQKNVLRGPFFVDVGVVFVRAFLLN